MSRKIVTLDEELFRFMHQRCKADAELGRRAVLIAKNETAAKTMVDYVVMVRRLIDALEKARDE